MRNKLCSVFDSKAEAFLPPFYTQTTATAIRQFEAAVNEFGHEFQKFAGDYTLFELAEFEPNTGKIIVHDAPINLGLAITFLRTEPAAPIANLSPISGGE